MPTLKPVKTLVCDSDALLPFYSLVEGPIRRLDDLLDVERFIRSVLLHDEIEVEITPMNKHWEVSEETVAEYKRCGLEVPGLPPESWDGRLEDYNLFKFVNILAVPEIELAE